MSEPIELYTTAGCPYSEAAREDLEWRGMDFVEYDVEEDQQARTRMLDSRPGVPAFCEIVTPDNRPASALERLSTGTSSKSLLFAVVTAPVTVARSWTR